MTLRVSQSRHARRAALGAELRRLRELAGLSGASIGRMLGVSPAKISRIESGDRPASLPEVRAWAQAADSAAGQPLADLGRLEWLAEQALTEAVPLTEWQAEAGEAGIQADISRRLEQTSRLIASYCPGRLTGLLQTHEYARRVYSLLVSPDEVDAAVTARLARQQVLYDRARRLEFIVAEAALRWHAGPADFLPPQMDRLVTLAALPNVALYVIPSDADMRTTPGCEFTLYDERDDDEEPLVAVELLHDYIETEKVQPYRDKLVLLRRSALSGDEAVAFIQSI
jgi:transcriptional regulator with XRE-family HTH domain